MLSGGSNIFAGLGLADVSAADGQAIREISRIVSTRSARIAGTAIAAVVTWMDAHLEAGHTVAIDGSLFEKYPGYQDAMRLLLQDLFGNRAARIKLELVRDGSGIGSAIIGAVAASSRC
jgi:hexokinase